MKQKISPVTDQFTSHWSVHQITKKYHQITKRYPQSLISFWLSNFFGSMRMRGLLLLLLRHLCLSAGTITRLFTSVMWWNIRSHDRWCACNNNKKNSWFYVPVVDQKRQILLEWPNHHQVLIVRNFVSAKSLLRYNFNCPTGVYWLNW